jgi:glucokinase
VYDQSVKTTNLPWMVEAADLAPLIGVPDVLLLNDIEAIGHGIGALDDRAFVTLHEGAGMTPAHYRFGNGHITFKERLA